MYALVTVKTSFKDLSNTCWHNFLSSEICYDSDSTYSTFRRSTENSFVPSEHKLTVPSFTELHCTSNVCHLELQVFKASKDC